MYINVSNMIHIRRSYMRWDNSLSVFTLHAMQVSMWLWLDARFQKWYRVSGRDDLHRWC